MWCGRKGIGWERVGVGGREFLLREKGYRAWYLYVWYLCRCGICAGVCDMHMGLTHAYMCDVILA